MSKELQALRGLGIVTSLTITLAFICIGISFLVK